MAGRESRRMVPGGFLLMALQFPGWVLAWQPQRSESNRVKQFYVSPNSEPAMKRRERIEKVRERIKYVFVIYQENRSFDSYFGTYQEAEGLFSHAPASTPGAWARTAAISRSTGILCASISR